jgi:immune inhibitor A
VLALLGSVALAREVPTRGDLRLLVLRAEFPDRPLAQDGAYFVGAPAALVDRLAAYYAEVSTGRLRILPMLADAVVRLPGIRASYVQRSPTLAADAIRGFALGARTDGDRRALAIADAVAVFFPGPGRESWLKAGTTGDPWSNFVDLPVPVEGFGSAIVVAADQYEGLSTFGVLCHEFGHLLGLPELYAPGAARHEGIGVWGLMGQGTWVGRGESPPHLDAWSKSRLGWIDVMTVDTTTAGVELSAVTERPLAVKIPAAVGKPAEYYLLENRQRIGADARLPGDGVLVWHVDESRLSLRGGQVRPERKLLHLVEADLRGDLDHGVAGGGNRGDASDPWTGPPRWRARAGALLGALGAVFVAVAVYRLTRGRPIVLVLVAAALGTALIATGSRLRAGPVCGPGTPGMAPYDGEPVRVVLRRFSPSGPVMSVDVLVARPDAPLPGSTVPVVPRDGTR